MLEVCVDSAAGARAAARGGADCIELCSSLSEGGLTPSVGLLSLVRTIMVRDVKVNVMIRCRAGSDFHYSDSEMETMLADIDILKRIGVDGFVFGALTEDQQIDVKNCSKIIETAGDIPVTFHRAFDVCSDPMNSLETIIEMGFSKILTSGQSASACDPEGVRMIHQLIQKSDGRITVMPGAGITERNVDALVCTGAKHFHSSCKVPAVLPRVRAPAMGTKDDHIIYTTDEEKVKSLKKTLKRLSVC